MKNMNVVKRIVALLLTIILSVTTVSENIAYASEDVRKIEPLETVLDEESEEAVSVENFEVNDSEETNEIRGTDEVEVTETEGTSNWVEIVSTSETLEETETGVEVLTEPEETEADIEEDIKATVSSNMKSECMPYLLWYCEQMDSIVMGGTTYKDALEFSVFGDDDIRAGFNLNGIYKTISFSVGHIDGKGAGANDIVLKIYRDKVEKGSYALNNDDIPKSIICSVEETQQFELVFEAQGSRYNPSYFGIGALNFSTEAIEEKPATVTNFSIDAMKEGTVNQVLTISGSMTLSEHKENISELLQNEVNNIQWTSSDESIAKVTNCAITNIDSTSRSAVLQINVTPFKAGTVRITGKTSNNKTSSCDITIKSSVLYH